MRVFGSALFRKYFFICSMCVLCSILVLGVTMLGFASRYFERTQFAMMNRFVAQTASVTAETYKERQPQAEEEGALAVAYAVVSNAIDADVFLTDTQGNILYYEDAGETTPGPATFSVIPIPLEAVQTAVRDGSFSQTGNLNGFFPGIRYTVGAPVYVNGKVLGVVFTSCMADELLVFLLELIEVFFLSAGVVLLFVFVAIYFVTVRMVDPLKNMLDFVKNFSQGDYSARVPVSGYDEIGQLSMAFNAMASTMATTESTRRSFVANVSHELRTPMTTISGFVDGILDGTVPREKHNQYLSIVSTECKRLSRMVQSMLNMTRMDAGELELHLTLFDISEIVRQTIFSFEQGIEEKQVEIRGLERDKVMVLADKDLMYQVIYNLIDNAVKFVDVGGYIEVSYKMEAAYMQVSIRNSGEGIPSEELPMLFERFFKSDRSRTNKKGVGLGLHIVRAIVRYHKGEIFARSVQGEYTEFFFTISNSLDALNSSY